MYINRKRIYRIISIILSAAFIFATIAGCSKTNTNASPSPSASQSGSPSSTPKASTSPTATPAQTEPGGVVIPTSTVDAVHVKDISVDKEALELFVGQSVTLTVSVNPDNATRKTISWTSANDTVATVSKTTGTTVTVTANAVGTVLIKAASEDSGKLAACIVTVKSASVEVTGITLSTVETTMTVGASMQITAAVTPSNASNRNLTWTSSAPSVAMASGDGTITAIGTGTAVITVKAASGKTATCTVHVKTALTGIAVSPTAQSMKIGNSLNLTVTVSPATADRPNLVWTSSNVSVATVENGTVTAKAVGETVITVKTEDGKFSATCTVYVSR